MSAAVARCDISLKQFRFRHVARPSNRLASGTAFYMPGEANRLTEWRGDGRFACETPILHNAPGKLDTTSH